MTRKHKNSENMSPIALASYFVYPKRSRLILISSVYLTLKILMNVCFLHFGEDLSEPLNECPSFGIAF